MPGGWFESVAEAQRRARRTLPKSVYMAIIAGSEGGLTLADNLAAFGELGFAPHVARAPAERSQGTRVMGHELALPVMISPTGVQAVHPDGEVAVARAAAARGTAIGLSSFGSMPVEEVVAANPQTFFQTYWCGTRDRLTERLERAKLAGVAGLIITLDWQFSHGRDWGSPIIPHSLDLKTMLSLAPETIIRPRWLLTWARSGGVPPLTVPNMTIRGEGPPKFFDAYGEWMQTPPPTWDDLAWLVAWWDGPVMIKGIARPDDARRAVDIGAMAISVSNHGGNNLDGQPASIRTLPSIVEAVNGDIEVVLDSGVRRGSDVVKALVLGARATMIGRAYLWGLAANGQAGVENVLDIFSAGIDAVLRGLGRASVGELEPSDVLLPADFARGAGVPA